MFKQNRKQTQLSNEMESLRTGWATEIKAHGHTTQQLTAEREEVQRLMAANDKLTDQLKGVQENLATALHTLSTLTAYTRHVEEARRLHRKILTWDEFQATQN